MRQSPTGVERHPDRADDGLEFFEDEVGQKREENPPAFEILSRGEMGAFGVKCMISWEI